MKVDCTDKSVLIADDAYFIRYKIKSHIQPLKFSRIYEAENGEQALDLYRRHEPDLALVDIIMPDTRGPNHLEKLMTEFPEARVIVISAVDVPDFLQECIGMGITDFVTKPFTKEELLEAVEAALEAGDNA